MVLVSALSGCAWLRTVNVLTTEEEVELGRQFDEKIQKEMPILDAPAINEYLQDVVDQLAQHSVRTDLEYRVRVVDSEEVNAFAVPGGFLYVNVGLLRAARDEAELAGVLAHEIGHVAARHGAKALTRQLGLAVLLELVRRENPSRSEEVLGALIALGGQGLMLKYSRDEELEADALGVQTLHRAGFDPEGLTRFFELLLQESGDVPRAFELFSTHPRTAERIRRTRELSRKLPPLSNPRRDSPEFQQMRRRLPSPSS